MPRLTTPTYLFRHYQLKQLWIHDQRLLGNLNYKDQIALHTYYLLSLNKTDVELIAHRRNVHLGDLSLPHRAGRAYARLKRGEQAPGSFADLPNGRRLTVWGVLRPDPDISMIAKVSMQIAVREAEERAIQKRAARDRALWVLTRHVIHASDPPPADVAQHPSA